MKTAWMEKVNFPLQYLLKVHIATRFIKLKPQQTFLRFFTVFLIIHTSNVLLLLLLWRLGYSQINLEGGGEH